MKDEMTIIREVQKEFFDLVNKMVRLELFIFTGSAKKISKDYEKLLLKQLKHMSLYGNALKKRIAWLQEKINQKKGD